MYISIAKEFYQNPNLFYHHVETIEIKKNQESLNIIKSCKINTLNKLLPIKNIIKHILENINLSQYTMSYSNKKILH